MPWSNNFTSTNQEHSGKIAGNFPNLFVYWSLLEQSCRVALALVYLCLSTQPVMQPVLFLAHSTTSSLGEQIMACVCY